jgi:hypothetical protein
MTIDANSFDSADVVSFDLPAEQAEHPWMKHAGMFKDDPLFDEVLEEIAIYRRELDADRPELNGASLLGFAVGDNDAIVGLS